MKKHFLDLARERFSARQYTTEKVTEEDLQYVLEAGRVAPSAVNYQPWKFLVIREEENLKGVHQLYHREWFRQAPVVIILLADHSLSWRRSDGKDHADIDVAIAADHMTLAATDRGLATCWVCNFDKDRTVSHFDLPSHLEPVVFIPLGHPATGPDPDRHDTKRKPRNEIIHYEKLSW